MGSYGLRSTSLLVPPRCRDARAMMSMGFEARVGAAEDQASPNPGHSAAGECPSLADCTLGSLDLEDGRDLAAEASGRERPPEAAFLAPVGPHALARGVSCCRGFNSPCSSVSLPSESHYPATRGGFGSERVAHSDGNTPWSHEVAESPRGVGDGLTDFDPNTGCWLGCLAPPMRQRHAMVTHGTRRPGAHLGSRRAEHAVGQSLGSCAVLLSDRVGAGGAPGAQRCKL